MSSFHSPADSTRQLLDRIEEARQASSKPLTLEAAEPLIRSIVASIEGDVSMTDLHLYGELENLARYIQRAKNEVAALSPEDIKANHLPSAHDELDAVVGATESATNKIMDACDAISAIAGKVDPESANALIDITTTIFEACNFQDITGQRITKVVKALKHIESKVETMIYALGQNAADRPPPSPPPPLEVEPFTPDVGVSDSGRSIAHGPQLPGKGIDQDEIDRLLASFG
jgi:chemotaxis protein CheZ